MPKVIYDALRQAGALVQTHVEKLEAELGRVVQLLGGVGNSPRNGGKDVDHERNRWENQEKWEKRKKSINCEVLMGKTYGKTHQTCRCNEDRMVIFDGIFMECWLTPSGVIKHANFHNFLRFDGKVIELNGRLSAGKKMSTGRYLFF